MELKNIDPATLPEIEPEVIEQIENEYIKLLKRMNLAQNEPRKEPIKARNAKTDIEKAKKRFEELKKARI